MSDGLGAGMKRVAALFGSLLLTYDLFAAASEAAQLAGRSAEFGPALVGFFATLFLVFEAVTRYFGVSPPTEFQEAMDDV